MPDLDQARVALRSAGIPIHRDDGSGLVIAPEVTGGVTLVVERQLLPGDPRSTRGGERTVQASVLLAHRTFGVSAAPHSQRNSGVRFSTNARRASSLSAWRLTRCV